MPELPEVETVRRGLLPVMEGQIIKSADIRRADLRWPFPPKMKARLTGQRVIRLGRRAKYILCDLSSGETLIIHLGMSGRMLIDGGETSALFHPKRTPEKHDHVVLEMESGVRIVFNDARRFGSMDLCASDAVSDHKLLGSLGPEPLGNSFDERYLRSALKTRNMPIKSALLDQKIVAGLGNIYVCEALWSAGISPIRASRSISSARIARLVPAIRQILRAAIESGGSSLKDFRQTSGEMGYFQHNFSVYDRACEPCRSPDCKGTIARITQSGRSTFYCPRCQR